MAALEYIDACESYALILTQKTGISRLAPQSRRNLPVTRVPIPRALGIYDWILSTYPNHPKTPQALFLKAFTYDSDLKDYDRARELYTEFLSTYPEDQFAPSATFLLENLGKDDEELLKTLEEKAKEEEQEPS